MMKNTWYDDTIYSEFKGKHDLKKDLKCDVLVVGGGLAGLSLLYNLKKNNVDAVLIEEKQIGSGASGRNGGFCLSGWAQDYDVLEESGVTFRGLFLVDKEGIVRHQLVNDLPLGRNIQEAKRIVEALQFHEKNGEVCPANWKEGQKSMVKAMSM